MFPLVAGRSGILRRLFAGLRRPYSASAVVLGARQGARRGLVAAHAARAPSAARWSTTSEVSPLSRNETPSDQLSGRK